MSYSQYDPGTGRSGIEHGDEAPFIRPRSEPEPYREPTTVASLPAGLDRAGQLVLAEHGIEPLLVGRHAINLLSRTLGTDSSPLPYADIDVEGRTIVIDPDTRIQRFLPYKAALMPSAERTPLLNREAADGRFTYLLPYGDTAARMGVTAMRCGLDGIFKGVNQTGCLSLKSCVPELQFGDISRKLPSESVTPWHIEFGLGDDKIGRIAILPPSTQVHLTDADHYLSGVWNTISGRVTGRDREETRQIQGLSWLLAHRLFGYQHAEDLFGERLVPPWLRKLGGVAEGFEETGAVFASFFDDIRHKNHQRGHRLSREWRRHGVFWTNLAIPRSQDVYRQELESAATWSARVKAQLAINQLVHREIPSYGYTEWNTGAKKTRRG